MNLTDHRGAPLSGSLPTGSGGTPLVLSATPSARRFGPCLLCVAGPRVDRTEVRLVVCAALSERHDVVDLVGAAQSADVADPVVLLHDSLRSPLLPRTTDRVLGARAAGPWLHRVDRTRHELGAARLAADLSGSAHTTERRERRCLRERHACEQVTADRFLCAGIAPPHSAQARLQRSVGPASGQVTPRTMSATELGEIPKSWARVNQRSPRRARLRTSPAPSRVSFFPSVAR